MFVPHQPRVAFEEVDAADLAEAGGELLAADAGVQEAGVDGIEDGVQHLEPVAPERRPVGHHLHVRQLEGVVDGELGHLLRRAEEGEHEPPVLEGGVRSEPHPALQPLLRLRRLARRLQQGAVDVEVPAVVAAADPAPVAGAVLQGGPPVRAAPVHEPDPRLAVAEQHQVLAQDPHRDRQVGDLRRQRHRMPEPPQVLAARSARADADELVVGLGVAPGSVPPVVRIGEPVERRRPRSRRAVHRRRLTTSSWKPRTESSHTGESTPPSAAASDVRPC